MRWPLLFGVGVLGLAAAALLLYPFEEPAPAGTPPPTGGPLVASVNSAPNACSLCHYAWDVPFRFNGSVEPVDGGWRYRFEFAPTAAFNLTDVRVVPIVRGDETLSAFRIPDATQLPRGGGAEVPIHVAREAAAVHVLLEAAREYTRSDLRLTIASANGSWEGIGAGGVRAATAVGDGPLPPGDYVARLAYVDGAQLTEDVRLLIDIAPAGVAVAPLATPETPARLELVLPERVRGFAVQMRPMNEHPTEKWLLPNWGDRGEYSVHVSEGEPPPAREWTAAEIDAAWSGATERAFHESEQDGFVTRVRDQRGEWTRRQQWITPPGPEEPFPPLPPGTREVVAELTWSGRLPVSPAPPPFFGWATGLDPTFYYPEPEEEAAGRRTYVLPVDPAWWQDADAVGGFQGFALLPTDERGVTVFDGAWGIRMTARR